MLLASQVKISPEWVMLRMINIKLISDSRCTYIEEGLDAMIEPFCKK